MKRKVLVLLVLASAAALWWYKPWPTADLTKLPAIERFSTRVRLKEQDRIAMTQAVRHVLRGDAVPSVSAPVRGRTMVFLSVFFPGTEPVFARSEIAPFDEAWTQAIERLSADPALRERFGEHAKDARIKVDIATSLRRLKVKDDPKKMNFETGMDGLILQRKNDLVVQPPWDILVNDWEVREGQGRLRRRMTEQVQLLSLQAGRGRFGWKNARLYRFRTYGFIQDKAGTKSRRLYRSLDPKYGFPSGDELRAAVTSASDWIVRNMSEDGKFTYLYYPVADDQNISLNYGVVRHAAAVYGLYAAYNALGDDRFYDAAEKSLNWMKDVTRAPIFAGETMSVRQNGLSILGATSLGLLSLIEKPRDRVTPEEADLARRMADFLLVMQMEDGAYYAAYEQKLIGWRPSVPPLYFPGESFLALVRYYQWTGEAKYLESAKLAARKQIAEFEQSGVPDHWCIQALSILAGIDADPLWADACLRMADYHLRHQHVKADHDDDIYNDYIGGYDNSRPPRATPAGSRTEAMSAAWDLAARTGHPLEKEIGDNVLRAARFIMNNQYRPDIDYFVKNPERAAGGIRGGLVDNTVRVDYNQHCIVAMLGAMRVLAFRGE